MVSRDKLMHQRLLDFLRKEVLEVDATQGAAITDPERLLMKLGELRDAVKREDTAAHQGEELREPGDYLVAEAIGFRADEWRNLFVPEFLAAQELLSRNVTVLTGARGCGKTMAFRRLTAFMDRVIGESSGVKGADQFVGFYMNCRDLVEAFPWLPRKLKPASQRQLIHYFHLGWLMEVLRTLEEYVSVPGELSWLDGFMVASFPGRFRPGPSGTDALGNAVAFLVSEKERCRLAPLGREEEAGDWSLSRLDFLDILQVELEKHVAWIGRKPLYLFLDDYTIPIVVRDVQRVLNSIIFKRRSSLFFKVSTEAANSFDRQGVRGKPLELHQDFELIDLASESLHQHAQEKTILLEKIFKPRIDRHPHLKGANLSLRDVLGTMPLSNNEMASRMRGARSGQKKEKVAYHGIESFVGMWSSDIRIMIQIFVDMFRAANGAVRSGDHVIPVDIQNQIYRNAGGEFLGFTESARDPSTWEKEGRKVRARESYGRHLKDIVEAFTKVSRYEMTEGPLIANEKARVPKQAFRLEILDKFEIGPEAQGYYEGLVRWHIFLQDWRGRSVRGMITPRLYLNRVLIPFCNLTFSSRDHVSLKSAEFASLLIKPKDFPDFWRKKRRRDGDDPNAQELIR
jgi:hypothetical protein